MKELQGKVSFTEGLGVGGHVKVWKIFSEKFEKVENCSGFEMDHSYGIIAVSQVVLVVKNMPANAGDIRDIVLIPGSEEPLEEEMITHSSILAWSIPWTEEPHGLQPLSHQKLETEHLSTRNRGM